MLCHSCLVSALLPRVRHVRTVHNPIATVHHHLLPHANFMPFDGSHRASVVCTGLPSPSCAAPKRMGMSGVHIPFVGPMATDARVGVGAGIAGWPACTGAGYGRFS